MGIFGDMMTCIELGERIAKGEGEAVKQELLGDIRKNKDAPTEAQAAPAPCTRPAPPGYRCVGAHDDEGRCVTFEVER